MTTRTGALVRHDDPDIAITGTLERLSGVALIASATLGDDGLAGVEWTGDTKIWWEEQHTVRDARGLLVFIDENGLELTQDQLALRMEDGEIVFPVRFPVSI